MDFENPMEKFRIEKRWRARVYEYVKLQNDAKRRSNRTKQGQTENCSPEEFCKREDIDASAFRQWMDYIKAEDKFVFYRSFAPEYLRRAKRAIELLDQYMDIDPHLRMPLLRDAIVSYAAVFRKSKGRVFTKWHLDAEVLVPQNLGEVHKKICSDRDTIVAHCDLNTRDPRASLVGVSMIGRGYYWEDYKTLLPDFRDLVQAMLSNLDEYCIKEGLMYIEDAFRGIPDPPLTGM
jgi:hypothetical protein